MPSFPGNAGQLPASYYGNALNGIMLIADREFPKDDDLDGPAKGIIVKWRHGTNFKKVNDYIIRLDDGEILVSVKKPSDTALIKCDLGKISIDSNGDVLARFDHGVLRVANLDALGKSVKVQFEQDVLGKLEEITIAIAPGYELIASAERLTRSEIRPSDGMARRDFKLLENGHIAICEISVESVLKASDVIADLRQASSGLQERRIVGGLSKMAAVLNYKNGTQGFSVDDSGALASGQNAVSQ